MKKETEPGPGNLTAPLLGSMNLVWANVLRLSIPLRLAKGATIVQDGARPPDFYYLAKGKVHLMHCAEDGAERTILIIGPGNLLNTATSLTGYDAPDCFFLCTQNCSLYKFSGKLLHSPQFISEYPALIINLMISQSTKVLMMHAGLSGTVGRTARQRLSRFIYSLAMRRGEALEFDPGLTQDDLATILGMHRASVVRALSDLRSLGAVLKFTKHSLAIGDMELLRKLAE